MSELPIQTNSHIFTNKNGNTLMREFVGIFSKSRHLYDLAQSMSTDIAIRAIINNELWNIAHHHRDLFTSMSEVDYTPDIRKCIKLLPLNEVIVNCGKNGKTDPLKTDEGDPWKTVQTVPRKTEEIDHLKTLQIAPPRRSLKSCLFAGF